MFYAHLTHENGEFVKARFHTKADRDQFIADHNGAAIAVTAKAAKFVPGADGNVTFDHRDERGWIRL